MNAELIAKYVGRVGEFRRNLSSLHEGEIGSLRSPL